MVTATSLPSQALSNRRVQAATRALLLLAGVAGIALMLFVTRHGSGLGSDSAEYIRAARSFAEQYRLGFTSEDGVYHPLTIFAPLFSLALSSFAWMGLDAVAGARLLNAFLFGANIFLTGALVWKVTRSALFALLGAGVFLTSLVMVQVHSWAMSEPLFLFFILVELLALVTYIESLDRSVLVVAAVAAELGWLTRYVGVSLVALAIPVLLLNTRLPWRRRLSDLGLFLAVSLPLNLAWMVRNYLLTGAAASRVFSLALPSAAELRQLAETFLAWFAPSSLAARLARDYPSASLLAILGFLLLGILFWLWWDQPRGEDSLEWRFNAGPGLVMASFVLAYAGLYGLSYILFFPHPDMNNRIFAPIHLAVLVLLVSLLAAAWRWEAPALQATALLAGLALLAGFAYRLQPVAWKLSQDGQGLASARWQASGTMQAIRQLPRARPLYTNLPGEVYLLAGRSPAMIPLDIPELSTPYAVSLQSMHQLMREKGALLALFDQDSYAPAVTRKNTIVQGLQLVQRLEDGAIYKLPGAATP